MVLVAPVNTENEHRNKSHLIVICTELLKSLLISINGLALCDENKMFPHILTVYCYMLVWNYVESTKIASKEPS